MFFHDVVNIEQSYWKRIAPRRTIARVSSRVRFCKLTPSPTRHSDLIYVEKVIYVRPSSYCLDTEDLKCVFSSKKRKKNFSLYRRGYEGRCQQRLAIMSIVNLYVNDNCLWIAIAIDCYVRRFNESDSIAVLLLLQPLSSLT